MKKTGKILLTLLLTICILNMSTVYGTEVLQDEETTNSSITNTQEILEMIPDAISLEIPEIEATELVEDNWHVGEDLASSKIYELLEEKGIVFPITLSEENNGDDWSRKFISGVRIGFGSDIREMDISVTVTHEHGSGYTGSTMFEDEVAKKITVTYTNSSNYNENDRVEVAKMLEKNDGFDNITTSYSFDEKFEMNSETSFEKAMRELIYDDSINFKIIYHEGAYDYTWKDIYTEAHFRVAVFKNGICYDIINTTYYRMRLVEIPDEIYDTEEAYINYAINELKNNWANASDYNISLEKNNGYYYSVLLNGEWSLYIAAKKSNQVLLADCITVSENFNIDISSIDKETNDYADMRRKALEKGFDNIWGSYEFKLRSGNIGENGLTIRFEVGREYNGKQVIILHKKQDGTIEQFIKTVENGRVSITVFELSPFMIAIKDTTSTGTNNELNETPTTGTNNKLDETPTTGTTMEILNILSIVTLISLTGIIITKKYSK